MSAGAEYTVREFGRRRDDGQVEVLIALPEDEASSRFLDTRVKLLPVIANTLRVKWSEMRGYVIVSRLVTGHDHVIDSGLLAGTALTLKQLRPTIVTSQTDWVEVTDA